MIFSRNAISKAAVAVGFAIASALSSQAVLAEENQNSESASSASLEKEADNDLGSLIESWANEMDHVFSETLIEAKDTTTALFSRLGIKDPQFTKHVAGIKSKDNPFKRLIPGRTVQAKLTPEGKVLSIKVFKPTDLLSKEVSFFEVSRSSVKSPFKSGPKTSAFTVSSVAVSGIVETSLEQATKNSKIPNSVLKQIQEQLEVSGLDVKKDLQKNDSFSVVYEHRQIDGIDLGAGRLLALEFFNKGKSIDIYWYEDEGVSGYFDAEGQSREQTFIRIPTAAKVTSAFNQLRRHPITGRLRPHWGVDLGAPMGTPVVASSDGVVTTKRFQKKGYGYYLEVNHGNGYSSTYAHLSKYAAGIAEGTKVKKGQVIGYVGRTGLATGPHLHYELKKNGSQINPMLADLPTAEGVTPENQQQFQLAIAPFKRQLALLGKIHLAGLPNNHH